MNASVVVMSVLAINITTAVVEVVVRVVVVVVVAIAVVVVIVIVIVVTVPSVVPSDRLKVKVMSNTLRTQTRAHQCLSTQIHNHKHFVPYCFLCAPIQVVGTMVRAVSRVRSQGQVRVQTDLPRRRTGLAPQSKVCFNARSGDVGANITQVQGQYTSKNVRARDT